MTEGKTEGKPSGLKRIELMGVEMDVGLYHQAADPEVGMWEEWGVETLWIGDTDCSETELVEFLEEEILKVLVRDYA